jgi:hypothetical protein
MSRRGQVRSAEPFHGLIHKVITFPLQEQNQLRFFELN